MQHAARSHSYAWYAPLVVFDLVALVEDDAAPPGAVERRLLARLGLAQVPVPGPGPGVCSPQDTWPREARMHDSCTHDDDGGWDGMGWDGMGWDGEPLTWAAMPIPPPLRSEEPASASATLPSLSTTPYDVMTRSAWAILRRKDPGEGA
jgi:hypothetical protein